MTSRRGCGACSSRPIRPCPTRRCWATLSRRRASQHFLNLPGPWDIEHTNIYRVHQRVAADFRRGRMLIVGDAAHVNNPLGAFGLNGALHAAFNLGEKLAKVARGEAR